MRRVKRRGHSRRVLKLLYPLVVFNPLVEKMRARKHFRRMQKLHWIEELGGKLLPEYLRTSDGREYVLTYNRHGIPAGLRRVANGG